MNYSRVERAAARADVDDPRDLSDYEYDTFEEIRAGDYWIAGQAEELVEVAAVDVGASAEDAEVTLHYHDRDAAYSLDSDESERYEYTCSARVLFAKMEADGGWHYVPLVKRHGAANCPVCGNFIPTNGGVRQFPWAGCDECDVTLGFDELEEEGVVTGILL